MGFKLKRMIATVFFFVLLTAFTPVWVKAAPKLSKTSVTMYIGNTTTLKVTGTSKTVKWKSNKPKVVTVSSKGKLKALKNGTATVTATVNTTKLSCKVTADLCGKLGW